MTRKTEYSADLLFDDLISEGISSFEGGSNLSIVEFAEDILFNAEYELYPPQKAILKAYYGEDLEDDEIAILETWCLDEKSTYIPGRSYSHLAWESGRRSSKCLSLNSLFNCPSLGLVYGYELLEKAMSINNQSELLSLEKGLQNIKDLTLKLPLTVAIEGYKKTAQASNFYIKGISKTKKVTTACGYTIEATPEHRIKVINSQGDIVWRYFSDVKKGEYACIHRNIELFPENYLSLSQFNIDKNEFGHQIKHYNLTGELDRNWGYLLGLLVGNGSWFSSNSIELSLHSQDEESYLQCLKSTILNIDSNIRYKLSKQSENGSRLRICSKYLRACLDKMGFTISSNIHNKKVPWVIRSSPKDVQAAFISGLFSADGTTSEKKLLVNFSTASKNLATEVQLLLLNFGIVSRLDTRKVKGKDYHFVSLRGKRSFTKFVQEITFGLERKQKRLEARLSKTPKDGGDTERIPYQTKWLQRIRESLPSNIGRQPGSHHASGKLLGTNYTEGFENIRNFREEFRRIAGNAVKENTTEFLSSYRLNKLIEFAEDFSTDIEAINHFKNLRDCDYFFDSIISVEDSECFCVDLCVPGVEQYVAQGFTNHNSTLISIISLYEFYKLISLPSPAQHYGLLPNSPIAIFVISQSLDQVKETLFAAIKGYAEGSDYFKGLVNAGKIEILSTEIRCSAKNVGIYAKHTNSKSLVGYSIKCLILDEAARFEIDEFGHSKADEIWQNVGRATRTFGKEGRKIAISSAWETGDYIEQLYEVAKKDASTLGFRLRTWDVNLNPNLSEAAIKSSEDYIKDPLLAALEYEGIRTSKQGSFFVPEHVKAAFTGISCLDARQIPLDIKNDEGEVRHYVGVQVDRLEHLSTGQSFAHCDYGVKKDSAAFSVVHPVRLDDGRWAIQVSGLMVWKPYLDKDRNNKGIRRVVSFLNAEEKIIQVCKARRVILMSFDSYNSEHTIQKLHTQGITTKEMKTSIPMQLTYYTVTKNLLSQGLLIFPRDSSWSPSLEAELLNLFQIPTTGKIDHGKAGKDISDAIANSVYNCFVHMAKSGLMSAMAGGISTIGSQAKEKVNQYTNNDLVKEKAAAKKLKGIIYKRF